MGHDSTLVWRLAITLTLACTMISCSRLDLLKEACPYSRFCTVDSIQPFTPSNDTMPCCFDCFCDEYCVLFNDCCPDVESNKSKFNNTTLSCRPTQIKTNATDDLAWYKPPGYRFIDFCPAGFKGNAMVVEKCEGDVDVRSDLDEAVLVSDNGGMIYKNKHCAMCHGVSEIHSWDLVISVCSEDIGMNHLLQSEMVSFLLNNCILKSERPDGIPVSGRTLDCEDVDTCLNDNMKEDEVDACLNGPYMPYMEEYMAGITRLHKNVFCYKCSKSQRGSNVCPNLNVLEGDNKGGGGSYRVLIIPDAATKAVTSASHRKCKEFEIFDYHEEKCRQLYCPPYQLVTSGKCVPFATPQNAYVIVNVVYTMANTTQVFTPDTLSLYNDSMVQQHLQQVRSTYRYVHCRIVTVALYAIIDKSTNTFVRLVLQMIYETNNDCSMTYIGENIRRGQSKQNKATWMLHGKSYTMAGQVSFYNDPPIVFNRDNLYVMLFHRTTLVKISSLDIFFVCPYVVLNHKEYINHVERSGYKGTEYDIKVMSPSSRYLRGFFPQSANKVASCIQDYLQKNTASSNKIGMVFLALSVYAHIFVAIQFIG